MAQNVCTHLSGSHQVRGAIPEEPLYRYPGRGWYAWDLYRVRVRYDYIPIRNCADPSQPVCQGGALAAGCTQDPLRGGRFQDFYVSLSGPIGAITYPSEDSLCVIGVDWDDGISRGVAANVQALGQAASAFPDTRIQVRLYAAGFIRDLGVDEEDRDEQGRHVIPGSSTWRPVTEIPGGTLVLASGAWRNNRSGEAYQVEHQYRYCTESHGPEADPDHCAPSSGNWSAPAVLESIRLRFQISGDAEDCPAGYAPTT